MQKLTETKFFMLMKDTTKIENELPILKNAYEEFIEFLMEKSNDNSQITILYNLLWYSRIELADMQKAASNDMKKKFHTGSKIPQQVYFFY